MRRAISRSGAAIAYISSQRRFFTSGLSICPSFQLQDPTLLTSSSTISSNKSSTTKITSEPPPQEHGIPNNSRSRRIFSVLNPGSTQDEINDGSNVVATLESMDREDAKAAIDRSSSALEGWRDRTTGSERGDILYRWADLIRENAEDLAKIMTLESGKPLIETHSEITYGISFLTYYAAEATRHTSAGGGIILPTPFTHPPQSSPESVAAFKAPRGTMLAKNEAVGPTAMITPWNFPLAMVTRKVGPALAAGCTVVLKCSELTPLTSIGLRELALRAGLPEDVFQLVIADKEATPEVGEEFCTNSIIKKISFTGSTAVGKHLMQMSSNTVKRLSLELGGNAPFIVFDDADIDQAVTSAIASKYRASGQTCVCADRFLLQDGIEEEFMSKLCEQVQKIQVGPGLKSGTEMGPLISQAAAHNVKQKVDEAIAEGAECVLGGNPIHDLGPNFFQPTVLRNVSPTSRIWATETFGPVVAISTFSTEEEAVHLANDTKSGLAAYFCSQDMKRVFRVAGRLESGIVGVNEGAISTATAPFGGVKESGLGREGGMAGIAEYLETKYIFLSV